MDVTNSSILVYSPTLNNNLVNPSQVLNITYAGLSFAFINDNITTNSQFAVTFLISLELVVVGPNATDLVLYYYDTSSSLWIDITIICSNASVSINNYVMNATVCSFGQYAIFSPYTNSSSLYPTQSAVVSTINNIFNISTQNTSSTPQGQQQSAAVVQLVSTLSDSLSLFSYVGGPPVSLLTQFVSIQTQKSKSKRKETKKKKK